MFPYSRKHHSAAPCEVRLKRNSTNENSMFLHLHNIPHALDILRRTAFRKDKLGLSGTYTVISINMLRHLGNQRRWLVETLDVSPVELSF